MECQMGRVKLLFLGLLGVAAVTVAPAAADEDTRFRLELEAGPAWQSKNDVQIPNSELGTRFSLKDLVGQGPWASGRLYFTWNINRRHGVRALLAPLSYTEIGSFDTLVDFAGASYQPRAPTEATYKFNSWRLSYRYRIKDGDRWKLWIGVTAKARDAKIALRQGETSSQDDDLGFVPLLYFGSDWRFAERWHFIFDIDALAGGPGRAIDLAAKLGYDISPRWALTVGYRTVEGGADVDDVYNFAWFNWATASVVFGF
jgi:hypothetical protein